MTASTQPENPYCIGDRVLHVKFGTGTVLSVTLSGATVEFDDKRTGIKNIVSSFLAPSDKPKPEASNDNRPPIFGNAQDLLGLAFPPVHYVLPRYFAEGLTLLGGRPKLGKSWLTLGTCMAVATGGTYLGEECEAGDVIYLALEDNARRLQDRMRKLLPPLKSLQPDLSRLCWLTEAPRINAGLIETLDDWRTHASGPKLVAIDTLAMVRPPKGRNQDSYAADYEALSPLQKWAGEHRIAVLVVTHVRKAEATDPLEMISGTNGLTGAADAIFVLNRDNDGPKLVGRGRDIEDVEKALRFDGGRWSVLGDADEVKRSGQRKKILAAFEASQAAMSPKEIAEVTELKPANVKYLLAKMVEAGELEKLSYGSYRPPQNV